MYVYIFAYIYIYMHAYSYSLSRPCADYASFRPSGLDLDRLPELSEVFRRSDEVMYGSWKPRLSSNRV